LKEPASSTHPLAIALLCAVAAAGMAAGARASSPASGTGQAGNLFLEVLSLGLEGYIHYDGPCLLRYRIKNPGPGRHVALGLSVVSTGKGLAKLSAFQITGGFTDVRQNLVLKAGEERLGQWILPVLREPYDPDVHLVLEARDEEGRIAAQAPMPRSNTGNPVVVLALDQEAAAPIRNAVLWRSGTEDPWYTPPEVALVLADLPRAWYVYRPARLVVLARSWAGLAKKEKEALEQWIAFGGTLVVVPQLCPDWQLEDLGDLTTDPTAGASLGAGRVMLAPTSAAGDAKRAVDDKVLRDWFNLTGLLRGYYDMTMPEISYAPLTQSYSMPSTLLLVLFILGIILLIGPVLHIVLARMRRREWAWAAVPAISLVLALGTYGVSTGIKGEGTVLEIHHVLKCFEGTDHATLSTYVRILASDRVHASLSLSAEHPVILTPSMYPDPFSGMSRAVPRILPDGLTLSGLDMPRWSYEDFTFLSSSRAVPLGLDFREEGVKVTNNSGLELRDLMVWTGKGWHAVKPRFTKGEKITVPWGGGEQSADMLKPSWTTGDAMKSMAGILASAMSPLPGNRDKVVVAAHCSPRGLPAVEMRPVPVKVLTDATCLWKSSVPPSISGGVR
jgi:hypothetical protein